MRTWKRTVVAGMVALALGAGAVFSPSASPAQAATAPTFTNYQLGTQYIGEVCPNGSQPCTNLAAEPAIGADAAGTFYGSSENGLGGGTQAWKSSDGGRHYTTLASPNALSRTSQPGVAPG